MPLAEQLKPNEYDAFISYSRRDREFAFSLEKRLEAYKPPKDLAVPRRRLKIFRDEGDLTGNEYFRSIERHLNGSAKLIVVCSPAACASEYVNDEIRRFVDANGPQNIIPILLAGIPNNEATPDQSGERAFPDALCEAMQMPLATSYLGFTGDKDKVQKGKFEGSWYTLLANLYEISRDEIEQRDRKRQRRTRRVAAAIAGAVIVSLAILAAIAWWQKGVADEQRNVALRGLSRYLASEVEKRIDSYPQTGLLLAVEAVRTTRDVDGYITPAAERAIRRALSAAGGRPLGGHRGGVVAAAFSPDGRRVGTIGRDGMAKVWELGELDAKPYSISIEPSTPSHMAFSPDGEWLAIGGQDPPFAGLWRIDDSTGTVLSLGRPIARIRVLEFSPDGSRLVMGSEDLRIQVWNVENPRSNPVALIGHQTHRDFQGRLQGIKQASFDPTGRWLVTAAWDGKALLWDLNLADPTPRVLLAKDSHWKPAHFSGDGRWLALPVSSAGTAWNDRLAVWRLDGATPVRVALTGNDLSTLTDIGDPTILGYHPRRPLLVTASESYVVLWNLETDPPQSHQFAGYSAALSLDGEWLATSDRKEVDGRIQHDILIRKVGNFEARPYQLTSFETTVKRLTFSPHGRHLAVVNDIGKVWLVQNDREAKFPLTHALGGHEGRIETEVFSPNGRWLLTATRWGGHSARLWLVDNPSSDPVRFTRVKPTPELKYKTQSGGGGGQPVGGLPCALAFDPLNRWIAAPGLRGTAMLVNLVDPTAAAVTLSGHTRDVTAITFDPAGTWVATADWNHAVRLWRPPDFDHPSIEFIAKDSPRVSSVSALAVDPQGKRIATGGASGEVAMWDTSRPGEPPRMIDAHNGWVTALAFNPDGSLLVTAAEDGDAKIWNLDKQESSPIVLKGHRGSIVRAFFSADGQRVVTAGIDSLVHVWSSKDPDLPPITLRGHSDKISSIALGSGSRWLVTGSVDGTARLWDLRALDSPSRLLGRFRAPVNAVTISADQQLIAAGDLSGEIHMWRREDPDRPPAVVTAVDTKNRQDDERRALWALGFSPDGRWLAALAGGELRLWRMRVEEQLELACALAGRNLSFDDWETHLAGIPYRLSCPSLGLHPDFITVTERLASQGEVERAAARFQAAKAIDPALAIEPHAYAVELAVKGHLEQSRHLARKGRLEAALAELGSVLRLKPDANFDPQTELARIVDAWKLHDKAETLASSGKVDEAVDTFQQALALDPSIDLDPQAEARRLHAPLIKKEADRLAREGRLDEATALYARALEDGLRSGLDPTSEARRVRSSAILEEARKIARSGELERAIETFNRALEFNPGLRVDPVSEARKLVAEHRVKLGDNLRRRGKFSESIAAYREAVDLNPKVMISPFTMNEICWTGVQKDLVTEVLWFCNEAVVREPDNGGFRDSRGVARALTADIEGAIDDFEAYVVWGQKNARSAETIAMRGRWIAGLRAGHTPSSFAELEALGKPK